MLFGLWSEIVGSEWPKNHELDGVQIPHYSGGPKEAQVQSYSPGGANVPTWEVHWCHLSNTIQPSVRGGVAVLCQITLTTCYELLPTVLWLCSAVGWLCESASPPSGQ